ncbi:MAG: asparaginase [Chitinophagales bacterium]|nr:asparaginase [Chitinophagales bacterium]
MSNGILLIYTGGTIGMVQDYETGTLKPFNFKNLRKHIPELSRFNFPIDSISLENPIDSSNMQPSIWVEIATIIEEKYDEYNGFVILHGSDTMAYTASALSFILENLDKPVVLTGSQLPMGIIRTDGRENLITAIEIAHAHKKGKPIIQEVVIYFEYYLYRGNRAVKSNATLFEAFSSPNYPVLAEAGVNIQYYGVSTPAKNKGKLTVNKQICHDVLSLRLFPGISNHTIEHLLLTPGLRGLVLETFGSGNAPTNKEFIALLKEAIQKGIVVVNVSQCLKGGVVQGTYETSKMLEEIGVISAKDLTFEAAITKLMYLLGIYSTPSKVKTFFQKNLRGEMMVD